jgi:rod shape-determining protein MreD
MWLVLLLSLGFVFDWWWGHYCLVWGLAPEWLLVSTVALSGLYGPVLGETYGFLWGIGLGTLSVRLFGAHALLLTVIAYVVGNGRRQMDLSSPPSQVLVTWLISSFYILALGLLAKVSGGEFQWAGWKVFLFGSLLNGAVSPLVFAAIEEILD